MADRLSATAYHERTKHSPESVRTGTGLDFDNKPIPYKRYVVRPRVTLPEDPPAPSPPTVDSIATDRPTPPDRAPFERTDPTSVDRSTIAQLCEYASGITKTIHRGGRTIPFRAAACTGALYHVNLYLVFGDGSDLDAGVYHYDPESPALDVLREGDVRGALAAASGHDRIADAPATFVATSTWWRNAWKYGDRTFRHAFWDSGTVLANLLAVAHARGLPASVVLGFADEPVVELLGLDPTEEAPLELIPVGSGAPAPSAPAIDRIDHRTRPLSPEPKPQPIIHRAWDAGVLSDDETAIEWRETARASLPVGTRPAGAGERVPLDPLDPDSVPARSLGRTIVRRGSCREYRREAIEFRTLSTVLDRASRGAPLDVREDGPTKDDADSNGPPLGFTDWYLIVAAVDGLSSGVYQYHPAAGELERLKTDASRRTAGHLALDQRLGADAAVWCYFMADIEAIVDELGDRGYRAAQFEAALTAGRLYLVTYAHRDLGGTGLTFYDDAVTSFLSPRAADQTPMFLYTLGRPA